MLLVHGSVASAALEVLDVTTASLVGASDRGSDGHSALRKALGYGWSVAAVADWARVRPALDRWLAEPDRDVRWVLLQNLRKNRLQRLDPVWVDAARPASPVGGARPSRAEWRGPRCPHPL